MTTSNTKKTPATSQTSQQRSTSDQEKTMPSSPATEGYGSGHGDLHNQAVAYLFELLPPQESQTFERQCNEQSAHRDALDETRRFQETLRYWQDVPAPANLAEKTIAAIQKQMSDEHDVNDSVPNV